MADFGLQFLNGFGESSDVEVLPANDLENKSADSYSASVVDSDFETSNTGAEWWKTNNTLVAKDWGEKFIMEHAQTQLPTQPAPQTAPQSSNSDSINLSFTMRDAVIFGAGAIAAMIIGKLIK